MEQEYPIYEEEEWTCLLCGGPMSSEPHWNYGRCDDCGHTEKKLDSEP